MLLRLLLTAAQRHACGDGGDGGACREQRWDCWCM